MYGAGPRPHSIPATTGIGSVALEASLAGVFLTSPLRIVDPGPARSALHHREWACQTAASSSYDSTDCLCNSTRPFLHCYSLFTSELLDEVSGAMDAIEQVTRSGVAACPVTCHTRQVCCCSSPCQCDRGWRLWSASECERGGLFQICYGACRHSRHTITSVPSNPGVHVSCACHAGQVGV